LARIIASAAPDETVLIDTQGVNPFSVPDMAELGSLTKAAAVEIILVMGAATNAVDSVEQARAFGQLGCSRILFTQLDLVHRYGGMLAAADATRLPFCEFSMTATIHEGLTVTDSARLASLLLPQPARNASATPATRGLLS
jgi:flagellar biosynthesis protein FlhF